ncbi:MAG: hypothetical protein AAB307_00125 [Deltaproteobacteria bacterium]
MPPLKLYSVFHCNLAFSSIPEADYPAVIERCYRPILKLCEAGYPLGIEMSAWTLKAVNAIDPAFVEDLKRLWDGGGCEFIGSGYSQAIFPLIPAEVNRWNLEAGNGYYERLLGRRPTTALVNEQTYSRGMPDIYREAGYETIIMDWDNSFQHNRYPREYKYNPQRAVGIKGEINVLWSHSIAFQKFQRCIHGEITIEEYLNYLSSHLDVGGQRAFGLYTNDAEVFDYRPGRDIRPENEYSFMARLLERVVSGPNMEIVPPSAVIDGFKGRPSAFNRISLESVETPVVCKKQEKYNPARWAVAGRDSVHLNSECYGAYENIRRLIDEGRADAETLRVFKETLCDLWGSDFRTNTIDEKFLYFQNRMGWLTMETERMLGRALSDKYLKNNKSEDNFNISSELLKSPVGCASSYPALKGEAAARGQAGQAHAPLAVIKRGEHTLSVSTGQVDIEFLTNKGCAIKSVIFPDVSSRPLIGTLAHGYYDDISLGADFFSGHLIHVARDGRKTADLKNVEPAVEETEGSVKVSVRIPLEIGALWKTYEVLKAGPELKVSYRLKVDGLSASSLRLGIFTLMPEGFDMESLWLETVNGGFDAERFHLRGHDVSHDEPVSQSVSASSCLGATEGWVRIGDGEKAIEFSSDKSRLFSVPMARFKAVGPEGTFFMRLYHSVGEVDDTAWWVWRGYNEITFSIKASKLR